MELRVQGLGDRFGFCICHYWGSVRVVGGRKMCEGNLRSSLADSYSKPLILCLIP